MLSRLSEDLTPSEIENLINLAAAYGILMRKDRIHYTNLPLSLFPTIFPAGPVNSLIALTTDFNSLMYNICQDTEFLYSQLRPITVIDEYTRNLMEIAEKTPLSQIFLALNRNDFFYEEESRSLKQVEFNTMASSFGAMATVTASFHRHALGLLERKLPGVDPSKVPEHSPLLGQAKAMLKAHELYGGKGQLMFLVLETESNYFDQGLLEIEIFKQGGVKVVRATLADVYEHGSRGTNNELFYQETEISVVYFRAGYSPAHYTTEAHWEARELIDTSNAVKTPNIHYHLAGSKKIQQVLTELGVLSNFIERGKAEEITRLFTGLWSLEQDLNSDFLENSRETCQEYVLKPQREGGGNNVYGQDLLKLLENYETDPKVRENLRQYVLMQKIHSKINENLVIRNGELERIETVSELGIFGSMVVVDGNVILNEYNGYLLRTKVKTDNEGGIAAGFSVIDSLYLE